jgi:Domain of unknown function (DUF4159)
MEKSISRETRYTLFISHMRRTRMVALVVVAVLAVSALSYAQRRRGGGGYRGGFYAPRRADATSFTGDFTFCRLAYRQAYDGDGGGWGVDYPRADQNLSIRLSELTKTRVNFDPAGDPNYYVVQATEDALGNCPFVMMSEFGGTFFDEKEAQGLREYMLKGGFLWVDDSWGSYAWQHWENEVRKIFPNSAEYPIVEVPLTHSLFHTLFDVNKFPQIPSIGWTYSGTTSERGADSAVPHARAILDARGRIMFFMTFNTDFGDSYEREGDDPSYFYKFSIDGYAIGIDTVIYAMTH